MQIFVGTSGWLYGWNEGRSLDWYIENSGLNAIELNASFYRFPFPNQVKSWAKKGENLRWVVKVSRRVTHLHKFNEEAKEVWKSFYELFTPLDPLIDFYLFQLPPSLHADDIEKVLSFFEFTNLGPRFALEARHTSWFEEDILARLKNYNLTFVSIDAPKLPNKVVKNNDFVYLRMHGRTAWYSYEYSEKELKDKALEIVKAEPYCVYVFFNNDHAMLKNAREMKALLEQLKGT